jgi:hypothetical protein
MLGTSATGIVTLKNAVVPVCPLAVKPILVAFAETLDMVASLAIEAVHPVPQLVVVVATTFRVALPELPL